MGICLLHAIAMIATAVCAAAIHQGEPLYLGLLDLLPKCPLLLERGAGWGGSATGASAEGLLEACALLCRHDPYALDLLRAESGAAGVGSASALSAHATGRDLNGAMVRS